MHTWSIRRKLTLNALRDLGVLYRDLRSVSGLIQYENQKRTIVDNIHEITRIQCYVYYDNVFFPYMCTFKVGACIQTVLSSKFNTIVKYHESNSFKHAETICHTTGELTLLIAGIDHIFAEKTGNC